MGADLILQFVVLGIVLLLLYLTINIKSFVAKPFVRKYLGGALIVAASMFGGVKKPKKEHETEKPSDPYKR